MVKTMFHVQHDAVQVRRVENEKDVYLFALPLNFPFRSFCLGKLLSSIRRFIGCALAKIHPATQKQMLD